MARNYLALCGRYELIEDRFARLLWLADGVLRLRRIVYPRPSYGPPPLPRRILVQSAMQMGDGVLAGAGIAALRKAHPDAEIDGLASPASAAVLRMVPGLDRVHVLDNPIYHLRLGRWRSFAAARRMFDGLRARRYDWAVDFVGDLPGNWALSRVGARATIAHDSLGGGPFLTHPVPRTWSNRTALEAAAEILPVLGIHDPLPPLALEPAGEDKKEAEAIARQNGLATGRYLVCSPGASAYRKAWPPNRFWATIERFASPRKMAAVLVGSAEEAPLLDEIAGAVSIRTLVFAGRPLGVVASLIEHAAAFLGNDTGPAHIAAAMETPRVVIFGPTPVGRFGHPGPRSVALSTDACPLLPCSYLTCKRPDAWCMLEIDVETAVSALERVTAL